MAVKRELKIKVWEQAPDKGFKATRGTGLNMCKVKKRVTDKILRKASMYGWSRRMPGGDRELTFKRAGRKPAKYDTEVKGGKCFIIPTC